MPQEMSEPVLYDELISRDCGYHAKNLSRL